MPAYSFQKQFVQMILDKSKTHTIRRRRKRPTKPRDMLMLYTAMRTKSCKLIAVTRCVKVEPLVIWVSIRKLSTSFGTGFFENKKVREIALSDGFDSVDDFFDFFKQYKSDTLDDFEIIHWDTDLMVVA